MILGEGIWYSIGELDHYLRVSVSNSIFITGGNSLLKNF